MVIYQVLKTLCSFLVNFYEINSNLSGNILRSSLYSNCTISSLYTQLSQFDALHRSTTWTPLSLNSFFLSHALRSQKEKQINSFPLFFSQLPKQLAMLKTWVSLGIIGVEKLQENYFRRYKTCLRNTNEVPQMVYSSDQSLKTLSYIKIFLGLSKDSSVLVTRLLTFPFWP